MSGPVKILNKDGKDEPDTGGGYNRMKEARVRAE
jgi:hypothetical protein